MSEDPIVPADEPTPSEPVAFEPRMPDEVSMPGAPIAFEPFMPQEPAAGPVAFEAFVPEEPIAFEPLELEPLESESFEPETLAHETLAHQELITSEAVALSEQIEVSDELPVVPVASPPDALPSISPRRRRLALPRPAMPRLGRRGAIAAAALGGILLLATGGAAYATYKYEQDYAGKILPGARIAGVAVGGMTPEQASDAIADAIQPQLARTIKVTWRDRTWKVSPEELGARSNADEAVAEALRASEATSFLNKAKMRLLGDDLAFRRSIAITYPRQGARGFIEGIASSLDRDVADASIDYSTGWVELEPERDGREVQVAESRRALLRALRTGAASVPLAVKVTKPTTTLADLDQVLLLRIGENKLYLYENGEISHSWTVATGQPEYPTPTGLYSITEKRYLPTWVNPDPDGWGADMPASIPPGPGNPLGTRALNWSAPAIRFHGTQANYSLGYNASHGCVRMAMPDVEFLYDLVDVGTPIVSITAGPLKPMYASGPDPTVVEESAEESGSGEGDRGGR